MKSLLIDTSHGIASVAVAIDCNIISYISDTEQSRQAERLIVFIEQMLSESDLSYTDIDNVLVCTGPGSFTGVRIGVAAARGIVLAGKQKLIGITSLEAIAAELENPKKKYILSALDARRGQVYAQIFDYNLSPVTDAIVCGYNDILSLAEKKECIITGNGTALIKNFLPSYEIGNPLALPDVRFMAQQKFLSKTGEEEVFPLYIRDHNS